jgi:hypothetical protein
MCAAIVTCVDAAPVLVPAEHDLDFVALAVEYCVVWIGTFRFAFDGMQAAILRFARAARNQSAS